MPAECDTGAVLVRFGLIEVAFVVTFVSMLVACFTTPFVRASSTVDAFGVSLLKVWLMRLHLIALNL